MIINIIKKFLKKEEPPKCGESHDYKLKGYNDMIGSKEIIYFEYTHPNFYLKAERKDKIVQLNAHGGYSNQRDGKLFKICTEIKDLSILQKIQKIIDKYNVSEDNGHCIHVDGLPSGLGDTIDVKYESGEAIYKSSNQRMMIQEEASQEFYKVFHQYLKKQGFEFNSKGSNVQLYDDADKEYLQGTWSGKHFGNNISVTFENNMITILIDGQEVDKEEYIIYEGAILPNRLKEGINKPKSEYDYEIFKGVSKFKKKNDFIITGYFLETSYSTCELMNLDKANSKEK